MLGWKFERQSTAAGSIREQASRAAAVWGVYFQRTSLGKINALAGGGSWPVVSLGDAQRSAVATRLPLMRSSAWLGLTSREPGSIRPGSRRAWGMCGGVPGLSPLG